MKDKDFNEDEFLKNMLNNFLKNMFPYNINEKRKSFFEKLMNDENVNYQTSTFVTEDGTKVVISSGFKEFDPNYQRKPKTNIEKITYLEKQLEEFVINEEFEKAAETRDLIKSLEKESTKNNDDSIKLKDEENNLWDL